LNGETDARDAMSTKQKPKPHPSVPFYRACSALSQLQYKHGDDLELFINVVEIETLEILTDWLEQIRNATPRVREDR
jgi:hypothetical protein